MSDFTEPSQPADLPADAPAADPASSEVPAPDAPAGDDVAQDDGQDGAQDGAQDEAAPTDDAEADASDVAEADDDGEQAADGPADEAAADRPADREAPRATYAGPGSDIGTDRANTTDAADTADTADTDSHAAADEQPDTVQETGDVAATTDATDGSAETDTSDDGSGGEDTGDTGTSDTGTTSDEPTTAADSPSGPTFADLGLHASLLKVLDELGYEEPTGIQAEAIPALLEGNDLLGQAATGTGKTAAFSLPMLQRLLDDRDAGRSEGRKGPVGLVLAPTRELAMQVAEAIHTYGRAAGIRVLPVYGGQPIVRQLKELHRGVDVVVATPGRALDHIARGSLDLSGVDVVVLDEADEMLDMGFVEDIDAILSDVRDDAQTMLFSATMPRRIATLAADHLTNPIRITVKGDSPSGGENPQIREVVYVVPRHHKVAALARILDVESPDSAIVFCRTRVEVDELTRAMNARGYRAEALHGGIDQQGRDRVMGHLRDGSTELLIATDVAARGLDVDTLTHVVNHSLPQSPESYVHRIGRVGRAGRKGTAITLVAPREHRALRTVERHTGRKMEVEQVPTVADLRAKRLGLLSASVREAAMSDNLESFRPVVESLADEFDPVQIALAAIKVAHDETMGDEESDQPERLDASLEPERGGGGGGGKPGGGKGGGSSSSGGGKGGPPPSHATRLWVSIGRNAGMRPKDLVGAIANETSLAGRQVGAIHIAQRFSLVDVPAESADEVIAALQATRMRGTKAKVRRDKA